MDGVTLSPTNADANYQLGGRVSPHHATKVDLEPAWRKTDGGAGLGAGLTRGGDHEQGQRRHHSRTDPVT